MLRFLRFAVEFIAAFVGFIVLLALLVAWRLSSSPISSDFLTPYIEAGIESLVPGSDVHAGSSLLTWDNVDRAVVIHVRDVKIDDDDGDEIGSIPALDARVSLIGLLFAQFMPKDLNIEQPRLKLERNKDGAFVFGGMSVGSSRSAMQKPAPIKDVLHNLSEKMAHSALMHRLAVTDAVFDVHDDVTQKDWAVKIPEISLTRRSLSEMNAQLEYGALDGRMIVAVTQKNAEATLNVHYTYDPKKVQHKLSTDFENLTPAYLAGGHPETLGLGMASSADLPLSGKLEVTLDKQFVVEAANVQLHGDEGRIIYTDVWDKPCPVKSLDVQAVYDRTTQKLTVSDTHIDFGGPTLTFDVDGGASARPGQDMDYTARITIDNVPMSSYGDLWPKVLIPNARYWMVANMRDGAYTHGDVTLKGWFAWNDLDNLEINEGGGKVTATGGKITYLDGMPPATGVSAAATFDLKSLSVQVLSGGIGNIRMSPFTVDITGLAEVDQNIHIPLQVSGPVPEVLKLLDHPPLGYAKKLGIGPDDVQGNVSGLVDFKFPLLKTLQMKDLVINATADATGVSSTKLVPFLAIDQGNINMALDMSGFTLKGQALLDKIPFQVTWQQSFTDTPGKPLQQALLVGTVKDDQWAGLGITAFNGTKGPINVTFQMTRPSKTRTLFSGTLDMTPAALQFDILDWKKPANAAAVLKFNATQNGNQPINITMLDLHGDHLAVNGTASLSPDLSQILSLHFPKLMVGRTNAALNFTQSFGDGGSLKLDATGKSLDMAGLRGGDEPQKPDTRPKQFHIKVDRLFTGAAGEIDMAQGFATRDAQGWSAIELHGIVGGAAVGEGKPLNIALTPQPDGHRTLAITCDDFGEAMKGLGFTDTIKGGTLSVTGASTVDYPRLIVGNMKISSFTVERLPVLALLLNATSPFGFTGILTDSADFSRFEGDFNWEGDALTLTRAHAAGSAVGINVDGHIDLSTSEANLQGTLVPFSVMNKVLNYIPVIGGILTGGDDQGVLAVAYQIKGPLGKPDISVNPISLLTPGFLRNLFFRDDIDDKPQE